jgi:hypothetical protein
VDVVAAVSADEETTAVVEPGEGALDDPAVTAEPGAVLGLPSRDLGSDPAATELAAAAGVVVGPVSADARGASSRATYLAVHGRDAVEERDQLGAVVTPAGEPPGKRDPATIDQEMVL